MGPDVTRQFVQDLHNETLKLVCAAISSGNSMIQSMLQVAPQILNGLELGPAFSDRMPIWMWNQYALRFIDDIVRGDEESIHNNQSTQTVDIRDIGLSKDIIRDILRHESNMQNICIQSLFSFDDS